jgi:hypothetical protein
LVVLYLVAFDGNRETFCNAMQKDAVVCGKISMVPEAIYVSPQSIQS